MHPAIDDRYFYEEDLHSWRINFYDEEFDYYIENILFIK